MEYTTTTTRMYTHTPLIPHTHTHTHQVTERVLSVVKDFGKVEEGKLSPTAHFNKDLGLDSLDAVEVVMALEEEFAIEIPDAEADRILSVGDAVTYITAHPHAV